MTNFAILFAALIHDVDHYGMSNAQLVNENYSMAQLYEGKSVAEQYSIDVAWRLLMEPNFSNLRGYIFRTPKDLQHFRKILVNSVLATDIFGKNLKEFRETRWKRAFDSSSTNLAVTTEEDENRKKAIVIEHLIQTSDVSHTMRHWKIYQKWNSRLFNEAYRAYQSGHSPKNPADGWYEGELLFFDNYIIPLGKKLRVCGVFGVSCDEYLNYAQSNRLEWESKGRDIVIEWENTQMEGEGQVAYPIERYDL